MTTTTTTKSPNNSARFLLILLLPSLVASFSVMPAASRLTTTRLAADYYGGGPEPAEEDDQGLILSDLDQQMGQMRSKYPTSENEFLAAARQRALEKRASVEGGASDGDWQNLAEEKKEKFGEIDDWENSQKEAGNSDSQILMFTEPEGGEGEDGEDADPKLLLF